MAYYIVKTNDSLEKISKIYNLTTTEIKKENPHIRSWQNLAPGLKLRLPEIPSIIEDELEEIEPFIEDYYPKIDLNDLYIKKHEQETIKTKPTNHQNEQKNIDFEEDSSNEENKKIEVESGFEEGNNTNQNTSNMSEKNETNILKKSNFMYYNYPYNGYFPPINPYFNSNYYRHLRPRKRSKK